MELEHPLPGPARCPGLPRARRRPVRAGPGHHAGHRGDRRGLRRGGRSLAGVRTSGGETVRCRYLVNALGLLARSNIPALPGLDTFAGRTVHTNAWPDDLDITGQRVGVIGTGSTGAQFIVAAGPARSSPHRLPAQPAVQRALRQPTGHPGRGRPHQGALPRDLGPGARLGRGVRVRGEHRRGDERVRGGATAGVPGELGRRQRLPVHVRHVLRHRDRPGGQRRRRRVHPVQDRRDRRGPGDGPEAHTDRPLRQAAAVQRGLLRDLQPRQRRAGLDPGEPIAEVVPAGVRTADGVVHELDVLVLATGFDAVDGNYRAMDLRGRGGRHIDEHWTDGPTSYLGVSKAGFPNMFMILGPNGPFTNLPPSIEAQVEWIGELIGHAERSGIGTIEPTAEAEQGWSRLCREIADATLFPKADSWIFGANIPGKPNAVMFYMAGHKAYREELSTVARDGYRGFAMHGSGGSR
ncbi:hypothetical protein L7F22_025608 [Adiantum nelumboides]|nr:hypothetical protein [Adiantum nelumboides]